MNDLVYVMYNLKLKSRKVKEKGFVISFEDINSDDEWLIEDANEENVVQMQNHDNVEQVDVNVINVFEVDVVINDVESGSRGGNVDLNGSSSNLSSVNDEGVSSGA